MTQAQWLIEHLIMWKTSNVCEEHDSLELHAYKKIYIYFFGVALRSNADHGLLIFEFF